MIGIATKFAPAPERFEAARQAGFLRAELWTDASVLAGWRDVAATARDYPFDYAVHFPNQLDLPAGAVEQAVALYRDLGCRALIIHPPQLERHGEALVRLDPGLALAVENHKLTPAGFRRWAQDSPGLAFDVEHYWVHTLQDAPLPRLLEGVRDFLAEFAGKLRHVHLPGYLPGQPEHRPMYCSRDMVLGVLSLFEQAGFTGLIVSEVNVEHQNPPELRMDVLLFERWRQLHGGQAK